MDRKEFTTCALKSSLKMHQFSQCGQAVHQTRVISYRQNVAGFQVTSDSLFEPLRSNSECHFLACRGDFRTDLLDNIKHQFTVCSSPAPVPTLPRFLQEQAVTKSFEEFRDGTYLVA